MITTSTTTTRNPLESPAAIATAVVVPGIDPMRTRMRTKYAACGLSTSLALFEPFGRIPLPIGRPLPVRRDARLWVT